MFGEGWKKRHLKMLVIDLKWCLNSRADAMRKKAVGASSTLLEVTVIGSPPGSMMPGVTGDDPGRARWYSRWPLPSGSQARARPPTAFGCYAP
jgi:hypothetical protein